MAESIYPIQLGVPVVAAAPITFLGTGSAGELGACRRLVYPTAESSLLAPIIYQWSAFAHCLNPTRTLNLDNTALVHPSTKVVKTLGTSKVLRQEETLSDVIVTEIWEAKGGISMPTFFYRLLYEYLINPPAFVLTGANYIVWEPRDRTEKQYNVELLSLTAGPGDGESQHDVRDIRTESGQYDDALTLANTQPTGVIDKEVRLRMRIVSEVVEEEV